MEVKIGVVYTPKELVVDTDYDADEIRAAVEDAMRDGVPLLWLSDSKGRRIGVPTDKIAYVELGSDESGRPVGFGRT
jgi:hypothetical protein